MWGACMRGGDDQVSWCSAQSACRVHVSMARPSIDRAVTALSRAGAAAWRLLLSAGLRDMRASHQRGSGGLPPTQVVVDYVPEDPDQTQDAEEGDGDEEEEWDGKKPGYFDQVEEGEEATSLAGILEQKARKAFEAWKVPDHDKIPGRKDEDDPGLIGHGSDEDDKEAVLKFCKKWYICTKDGDEKCLEKIKYRDSTIFQEPWLDFFGEKALDWAVQNVSPGRGVCGRSVNVVPG